MTDQAQNANTMIRQNPIGLPEADAQQIVQFLNTDLASMQVLYNQYHKHHWIAEGAEFFRAPSIA